MSSRIFQNVLQPEDISAILEFYQHKPDAKTESYTINKNFEYHIPEDFSYQLLHEKIEKILGPHEFDTGAYKECIKPYPLHSDSPETHSSIESLMSFGTKKNLNLAILIPLVEGDEFCTVVFDCYSTQDLKNKQQPTPNQLKQQDFGHCTNQWPMLNRLPIVDVYHWRVGDVFIWDRQQYHVSADFAKYGLVKKFLIMFVS